VFVPVYNGRSLHLTVAYSVTVYQRQ